MASSWQLHEQVSAAEQLRARAGRIQARDRPAPVEQPAPEPAPVRTRPVRQTFDLSPDQHRALAAWRLETAVQLGRTGLSQQELMAAVVTVLLEDDTVARRVRAHLESHP